MAKQLAGEKPQRQFERALAELGVTVIHAHSSQAKGRVERLFKTLQDRLVRDLRMAGRATIEADNPRRSIKPKWTFPGTAACCLPVTKPWRPR